VPKFVEFLQNPEAPQLQVGCEGHSYVQREREAERVGEGGGRERDLEVLVDQTQ
jgi:hypothetical protein